MKTVLSLAFVLFISLSPKDTSVSNLTPSKQEIRSTETFSVLFELSSIEEYLYVEIVENEFEIIGERSWEGFLKEDDTLRLRFELRLKESMVPHVGKKVPITVRFDNTPFEGNLLTGETATTSVILIDYEEMQIRIHEGYRGLLREKDSND